MRRRHEAAGQGESRHRRHRGCQVQDLWMRQCDRQLIAGYGMAARQDRGRSAPDQEHRHRQRAEPAAGEDPLLGPAEDAIKAAISDYKKKAATKTEAVASTK